MNLVFSAARAVKRSPLRSIESALYRLEDAWFDWRWNVDTNTRVEQRQLKVDSANQVHAKPYYPTRGGAFRHALKHFGIKPQGHFVDLGSGKGRMLMLASQAGFEHAIGVEFAPELAAIAKENARQFIKLRGAGHINTLCMDATKYEFKAEDRMLFMYCPFGRTITQAVAEQLRHSLERSPRTFDVLYAQPDFVDTLTTCAPLHVRGQMTYGGFEFTWLRHEPAALG